MKKKLLLYLSSFHNPHKSAIAATLSWLSKSNNHIFDNYYDNYHQGVHFGGGDSRNLEMGQLSGGTVTGDRHFEEFYFLLHNFDVSILISLNTIYLSTIKHLNIPTVTLSEETNVFYKQIFGYFGTCLPQSIVMMGSNYEKAMTGLNAYVYPEIYYRQAMGVLDSIPEHELDNLYQKESKIFCLYVDEKVTDRLQKKGYNFEVIDQLHEGDDYLSVTERIARRWEHRTKGWILGDPVLVSHWLPKACEEDLISVYSIPQKKVIEKISDIISSKGNVIYGRQYSDKDFFQLSKLNQCLQVIDPCRPPFQSVKHVEYKWHNNQEKKGFYDQEYTDEELRQFSRENRVMISLMFWSGMIREIENFYNLIDLFAITRLKCGLVITAQIFEYMMHAPFELLTIPVERGGAYPLVEPVLGSCGIGVGIESYFGKNRLRKSLKDAMGRISQKVVNENYIPRGWWTTLDTDLEKLPLSRRPKPFRFLKYSPYFQFRYQPNEKQFEEKFNAAYKSKLNLDNDNMLNRLKKSIFDAGLMKYFERYRPYESFRPSCIKENIVETAKSVGLKYMFTKAGFNENPKVKYCDDHFIALNYTAGQWDGWTPFETINNVSDLRKSEKALLRKKKPGWIVSTIDSCLWTFGGEFWKRGSKLYEIAQFCVRGGRSNELINVKPHTVARYARIIDEQ